MVSRERSVRIGLISWNRSAHTVDLPSPWAADHRGVVSRGPESLLPRSSLAIALPDTSVDVRSGLAGVPFRGVDRSVSPPWLGVRPRA